MPVHGGTLEFIHETHELPTSAEFALTEPYLLFCLPVEEPVLRHLVSALAAV